jgi:hypothetical protein
MIGFITTQERAQAANAAVAQAQINRGLPVFWLPGSFPIFSGAHEGETFIPCDDALMDTPLLGSPVMSPKDFPEFAGIIAELGGLGARVEIDEQDITEPNVFWA